jgi:hypothetical protein
VTDQVFRGTMPVLYVPETQAVNIK